MLAPWLLAVAAAGAAGGHPTSRMTPLLDAAPQCCLAHASYGGVCVVVPGENETCDGILAYLNTPNTSGRTYCNSTRLRGGWQLVDCTAATAGISRTCAGAGAAVVATSTAVPAAHSQATR